MIVAVGFTSIVGEVQWALETAPHVDALGALVATVKTLLPTWPANFRPEEWQLCVMPSAALGDAVHWHSLVNSARTDRATVPDPKVAMADTTGASRCRELVAMYGAVASDVVLFIFAFVPTADHRIAAVAAMSNPDDVDAISHNIAPLTDVVYAGKLIGEAVRTSAAADYEPWSNSAVDLPASKLQTLLPVIAGKIHAIVSARGDTRGAKGEELPELRPA
jgi:hypothetical protein